MADQGAEVDQRERDVPDRARSRSPRSCSPARDPNETLKAGGYELGACSGNSKSLSTNQAISLGNAVTSSFCLPPFETSGVNVGIATSITELAGNAHTSEVCIAALGATCPGAAAMDFGPSMVTFEFRVWDAALEPGYKITQVFHNGATAPEVRLAGRGSERGRMRRRHHPAEGQPEDLDDHRPGRDERAVHLVS